MQPSITRTKEEAIAILQGYEQTIKQDLSQFPKLGTCCKCGVISQPHALTVLTELPPFPRLPLAPLAYRTRLMTHLAPCSTPPLMRGGVLPSFDSLRLLVALCIWRPRLLYARPDAEALRGRDVPPARRGGLERRLDRQRRSPYSSNRLKKSRRCRGRVVRGLDMTRSSAPCPDGSLPWSLVDRTRQKRHQRKVRAGAPAHCLGRRFKRDQVIQ